MVYDFGGGTLDVTILELLNKQYKVKTIKGNDHLGGQDFDVKILEWAIEEWNGQQDDDKMIIDVGKGFKKERARLRKHCTDAKL